MLDYVKIEPVHAVMEGFPFVCPVCHKEERSWDYIRVYLGESPNPGCIHIRCLLNIMGFTPEQVGRAVTLK